MAYTNSPLVAYTKISPNRTSPRNKSIDRISIHCVVGQCSVETIGQVFVPASRQASSNYGVGYDGKVGMYCEEKDRSWCTSSGANDHRAVTIEVASDTKHPYAVNDKAYAAMLDLVTDICKRNGKKKLLWFGDREKALSYAPATDEMVLTVHRWFAAKVCPGDYLYERHDAIAAEVTKRLGGAVSIPAAGTDTGDSLPYLVRVTATALNVRKGPGTNYAVTTTIRNKGVYTIVQEQDGWGRLKSGAGWIKLSYTTKL